MTSPFQNIGELKEYLDGLKTAVSLVPIDESERWLFNAFETSHPETKLSTFPDLTFSDFCELFNGYNHNSARSLIEYWWFCKRVLFPLRDLYLYRYNNMILRLRFSEILNTSSMENVSPFSSDEIYDMLTRLNYSVADYIMGILSSSSSKRLEGIRHAVSERKKELFVELLANDHYDIGNGSKLLKECLFVKDEKSASSKIISNQERLELNTELARIENDSKQLTINYAIVEMQRTIGLFDNDAAGVIDALRTEDISNQVDYIKNDLEKYSIGYVAMLLDPKYPLMTEERNLFDKIVNCKIFRMQHEKAKLFAAELYNTPEMESSPTIKEESKNVNNYIPIDGNESIVKNGKKTESNVDSESIKQFAFKPLTDADESEIDGFKISGGYFRNARTIANYLHFDNLKDEIKGTSGLSKEEFKTLAAKYQKFIRTLARKGCIYPDREVMKSCAYAFSGITFNGHTPTKVKWNLEKIDCLFFVCRYFYKSTNYDRAFTVFDVGCAKDDFSNPSAMTDRVDPSFKNEINTIYKGLVK